MSGTGGQEEISQRKMAMKHEIHWPEKRTETARANAAMESLLVRSKRLSRASERPRLEGAVLVGSSFRRRLRSQAEAAGTRRSIASSYRTAAQQEPD